MEHVATDEAVRIEMISGALDGFLTIPADSLAVVVFAHGSGSSRFSVRNKFVADVLRNAGLGTLLFDLLTPQEDRVIENRFDIDLLSKRLETATRWLRSQPEVEDFSIGYFGASTGAAAALRAAALPDLDIGAIVSRGGRPDMALDVLDRVKAPTLLIVGGLDHQVIELNKTAYQHIRAEKELRVIPGATHLFEEPRTLEMAASAASDWFRKYLT